MNEGGEPALEEGGRGRGLLGDRATDEADAGDTSKGLDKDKGADGGREGRDEREDDSGEEGGGRGGAWMGGGGMRLIVVRGSLPLFLSAEEWEEDDEAHAQVQDESQVHRQGQEA